MFSVIARNFQKKWMQLHRCLVFYFSKKMLYILICISKVDLANSTVWKFLAHSISKLLYLICAFFVFFLIWCRLTYFWNISHWIVLSVIITILGFLRALTMPMKALVFFRPLHKPIEKAVDNFYLKFLSIRF